MGRGSPGPGHGWGQLRPRPPQLQCSPPARLGWPSQTSVTRTVRHPSDLQCGHQSTPSSGSESEDIISVTDSLLPLSQRGSWERIPNLNLLNVPVIQNSFIMKVSKKTFPPDIVIPCSSGHKTKHWFLFLRLDRTWKQSFSAKVHIICSMEAVMLKQSHFYPHFITRDNGLQLTGNHLVFSHTQDITHLDNDFSKCVQDPNIAQNLKHTV